MTLPGAAACCLQTDSLATVHIHGCLCSLLSCVLGHNLHLHAICLLSSLQQDDSALTEVSCSRPALVYSRHAVWMPLQYMTGSTQRRGILRSMLQGYMRAAWHAYVSCLLNCVKERFRL